MAPPGVASPPASARRNHVSEKQPPINAARVTELVNAVRRLPQFDGMAINKISRLVRFGLADVNDGPLVTRVFAYADPTALTAIRNVIRERGW